MNTAQIAGLLFPAIKDLINIYGRHDPQLKNLSVLANTLANDIAIYASRIADGDEEARELLNITLSRADMIQTRIKILTGYESNIKLRDTILALVNLTISVAMMIK